MAKQIDNTNMDNIDFDPANTSILLNVKDVKIDTQIDTRIGREINKNNEQNEQNTQGADIQQNQVAEIRPTNPTNVEAKVIRRDSIYDLCASRRDKVLPFLGNNIQKFERLARSFAFEINTNSKLASCDSLSILQAFYKCCEYGLDPASSLQQTWMIPYNGKIDFQIGYKGWLKLLWSSRLITNAYSHAVYQGDLFEHELGLNPNIKHIPQSRSVNDASELIATYGVVKLKNNEVQLRVCWRDELEKSKKSSRSNGREDAPWNKHFEAMALMVPIRKMAKNLALALRVEDYDEEEYNLVMSDGNDNTLLETYAT